MMKKSGVVSLIVVSIVVCSCCGFALWILPSSENEGSEIAEDKGSISSEEGNQGNGISEICFSLSDTPRDSIYNAGDYWLWNKVEEWCDTSPTEQEIRDIGVEIGWSYCNNYVVRMEVIFLEDSTVNDIDSAGLYSGWSKVEDTLVWYDFKDTLKPLGIGENYTIHDGKIYLTFSPGVNGKDPSGDNYDEPYEFELRVKLEDGTNMKRIVELPRVDPFRCDSES